MTNIVDTCLDALVSDIEVSRRSVTLGLLGLAAAAYMPIIAGCDKKKDEKGKKEEKKSGKKTVFIYNQDIDSTLMEREALSVTDYWIPHLYDIRKKPIGANRTKKAKKSASPIEYTVNLVPRASIQTINRVKNKAAQSKVSLMPMISAFDYRVIESILSQPQKYSKEIADCIKRNDYNGVAIDFESVFVNGRHSKALVEFMSILRSELPKGKYTIAVAVSPRFKDNTNGFPHHGFYDFKALSSHVDFMHLMCYDFNKTRIGPNLPEDKIMPIIEYAKANIPAEKIVFLMPLYGSVWKQNCKGQWMKAQVLSSRNNDYYLDKLIDFNNKYNCGELYVRGTRKSMCTVVKYKEVRKKIIDKKKGMKPTVRYETVKRPYNVKEYRELEIVGYLQDAEVYRRRLQGISNNGVYNIGLWRQSHGSERMYDTIKDWKKK